MAVHVEFFDLFHKFAKYNNHLSEQEAMNAVDKFIENLDRYKKLEKFI